MSHWSVQARCRGAILAKVDVRFYPDYHLNPVGLAPLSSKEAMSTNERHVAGLLSAVTHARQTGDRREEKRLLEAALALDPEDPQILNALGMLALGDRRAAEAAGWFHRAALNDPAEPALWLNLASAQRAIGDDAGEESSLARALSCDQRHFMALLRKAELHQRRGEVAEAVQNWEGVLSLARSAGDMPPALAHTLADAGAFVADYRHSLSSTIDAQMAAARSALSPAARRRADACIDHALGRRRIYFNECHGVHFPFLPAEEFFDRALFPWLGALEARTGEIAEELHGIMADGDAALRPYVQQASGTPENKWTPLDGSLDWGVKFLWEYGVRDEALCARCPITASALSQIPQTEIAGRAPTAFFSILKPRTRIPPHSGVTNTRTIIHLPLVVPPACGFRVGGETRAWKVGEAFAFDDTIEHEAWNDSDELRAVLIFDVWNPYMTADECRLMRHFFELADANKGTVANLAGPK